MEKFWVVLGLLYLGFGAFMVCHGIAEIRRKQPASRVFHLFKSEPCEKGNGDAAS